MIQFFNSNLFNKIMQKMSEKDQIQKNLETKLAESESNVKVGEFWHSAYQGKQLDYDNLINDYNKLKEEINQLKQSQNQMIVAQLERVREFAIKNKFIISNYHNLDLEELNYGICVETLCKYLEQQIKLFKLNK